MVDTDLVDTMDMALDMVLFMDVRRGPLSPLLILKLIPICTMVLAATMVVTMDSVTTAVTTDSDTEDITGDKSGNQPISAMTSLPSLPHGTNSSDKNTKTTTTDCFC